MRDSMLIYRSFFEAIKELPLENQAEIWNAIFELGLNKNNIDLTGISATIFKLIKPQIEANLKRFENGKKPKTNKTEAKQKQTISKTEGNNNNNNNNNIIIPPFEEFLQYAIDKKPNVNKEEVGLKYESWKENEWSTNVNGKPRRIKNWKTTLLNTLPFLGVVKLDGSKDDYFLNIMSKIK